MNRIAILKNGELKMLADNVDTAMKLIRSLEAGMDRNTQHSPFTLLPESALTKQQIASAAIMTGFSN